MQQELFDKLLAENEIGILLLEGGKSLTGAQLEKVKDIARQQAKEEQRNDDISRGIRQSDVMNDYTQGLQQKFDSNRIGRAMNGETKLKGRTDDKMQEEPEEENKSKKDPNITKVAPNTHSKLKKGDSEADILAKMLNMMQDNYNNKKKKEAEYDRLKKVESENKNMQNKNLLKLFNHKKPKDKKKKEDSSNINWAKFAAMAGIVGVGLFGMEKAFASFKDKMKDFKIPDIEDIIKKPTIDTELPTSGDYVKEGHANLAKSLKSSEAVGGGASTEELYEALDYIQQVQPDVKITAMNDVEHHLAKYNKNGRIDPHVLGVAADIKLPVMNDKIAKQLEEDLNKQGMKSKVMYEPPTGPGTVNPEGHLHVQVSKYDKERKKLEDKPLMPETKQETPSIPAPEPEVPAEEPPIPPKLQLVPKDYPMQQTDEQVKSMQTVKGKSKNPGLKIVNQTIINQGPQVNVKQRIKKIEDENMEQNIALVKQFGVIGNK